MRSELTIAGNATLAAVAKHWQPFVHASVTQHFYTDIASRRCRDVRLLWPNVRVGTMLQDRDGGRCEHLHYALAMRVSSALSGLPSHDDSFSKLSEELQHLILFLIAQIAAWHAAKQRTILNGRLWRALSKKLHDWT
eukprot:scaffold71944_cov13-Prasinocladus_malaysianus.AAC.1